MYYIESDLYILYCILFFVLILIWSSMKKAYRYIKVKNSGNVVSLVVFCFNFQFQLENEDNKELTVFSF